MDVDAREGLPSPRRLVVIGASSGGVEALTTLVSALAPPFDAAVLVVMHLPTESESHLPAILARRATLPVAHATDGEVLPVGGILVAPPGLHLEVTGERVRLVRGPRENGFRPAIDPLFGSAARSWGHRVLAVILSGSLLDGVAGMMAVRNAGGIGIVQSPIDALFPDLPQRTIELAGADHVLPVNEIGALLTRLVGETDDAAPRAAPEQVPRDPHRQLSVFTCPECGGPLWQEDVQRALRFQCPVGHGFEIDRLHAMKGEQLEGALWTAVRVFKERALLSRQLAERERVDRNDGVAVRYDEQAEVAERDAAVIVDQLLGQSSPPLTNGRAGTR